MDGGDPAPYALTLVTLQGAFYVLAAGCGVAALAFVFLERFGDLTARMLRRTCGYGLCIGRYRASG